MQRLAYIDILRGLAILLMIVDHGYDWWLDAAGRETALARGARFAGALAAPLFLYLVGASLALSRGRAARRRQRRRDVAGHVLRRGMLLILLGYALNSAVFFVGDNPQDILAVDVLQVIGVSICLSLPLLWAPLPLIAASSLALAILGQTAGTWTLPAWLAAYVTGNEGIGYFPLALWLPYVYVGLAVGGHLARATRPGRSMAVLGGLGLAALACSALIDPGWGYRHPRPAFVLFSWGLIWLGTAVVWTWVEHGARDEWGLRILRQMGQASLLIYVLHHIVGYRLFWLAGWVSGRAWRGEYGVMAPLPATALLVGLIGLMAASSYFWLRWRASRPASRRAAPGRAASR